MNEDFSYYLDAAKYLHRLPVRHRADSSQKASKPEAKKDKLPQPAPINKGSKDDGQP